MPAHGFVRPRPRAAISTNCSGRQRRPRARLRSRAMRRRRACVRSRTRERGNRSGDVLALNREALVGIVGRLDRGAQRDATASNQRAASKPTTSLTRRLSMLLKARSARSISQLAAMRAAVERRSSPRERKLRSVASAPPRSHARDRPEVVRAASRRTAARAHAVATDDRVFEGLECRDVRTLTWRSLLRDAAPGVGLPGGRDDQQHRRTPARPRWSPRSRTAAE